MIQHFWDRHQMDPYTWFKVKSRTVLKPAVQITTQVREDKKSFLAASVNNNRDLNFRFVGLNMSIMNWKQTWNKPDVIVPSKWGNRLLYFDFLCSLLQHIEMHIISLSKQCCCSSYVESHIFFACIIHSPILCSRTIL